MAALVEHESNLVELFRPILDTYPDCPVALVGCRSQGIERSCCEHDLVVVTKDPRPSSSIRFGGACLDIYFLSEKEALSPSDPEVAVSLAFARTVRDSALLLTSGCSAARAVLRESTRRSASSRLASSLKAIGRTEEALSSGTIADADFWLLSAAYDFAFAWLYTADVKPAPSHLLSQLKKQSEGNSERFQGFAGASGLGLASKAACESRLDSIGVLYDMIEAPLSDRQSSAGSGRVAYEVAKGKTRFLTTSNEPVDCFCYLGCELVRIFPAVAASHVGQEKAREQPHPVSQLTVGGEKVLSKAVVAQLGLTRDERSIRSAARTLQDQVSHLSRLT